MGALLQHAATAGLNPLGLLGRLLLNRDGHLVLVLQTGWARYGQLKEQFLLLLSNVRSTNSNSLSN